MNYQLKNIASLEFPVIYFTHDLKDISITKTTLEFDNYIVYKDSDNIIDSFANANAPTKEIYSCAAEFIVGNFNKKKRRVFIDNSFNLIVASQNILVTMFTVPIDLETKDYFLSYQIPCYLEKVIPKAGKFPVVAKVNAMYFHVGWSDKFEHRVGKL